MNVNIHGFCRKHALTFDRTTGVKKGMRLTTFISMLLTQIWHCSSCYGDIIELRYFIEGNGFKFVNVVGDERFALRITLGLGRQSHLPTYMRSSSTLLSGPTIGLLVFPFRPRRDRGLDSILRQISTIEPKSALLWCPECHLEELKKYLDRLPNALFYTFTSEEGWLQVISLRSGYSVGALQFQPGGRYVIAERYNLNGLLVSFIALPWPPLIDAEDCDPESKDCTGKGFFEDYVSEAASLMNFTYTLSFDPDGDWGVLPVSGPYNSSGTWSGVMGAVVNGEHDVGLGNWEWLPERETILSHVPAGNKRRVLAMSPRTPPVDWGLFVEPFTKGSWMLVGLAGLAGVCICVLVVACSGIYDNARLVATGTMWFFVLLVHSYYTGALTMFFATTSSPFSGIREVIDAMPAWKLLFMAGDEGVIKLKAMSDPHFAKYWTWAEANMEEAKFATVREGLDRLVAEGRVVLVIDQIVVVGFLKENPRYARLVTTVAASSEGYSHLVLTKNSPLKAVLSKASKMFAGSGLLQRLDAKYQGKVSDHHRVEADQLAALTPGQAALVFALLAASLVLCCLCFCGELAFSRLMLFLWNGEHFAKSKQTMEPPNYRP